MDYVEIFTVVTGIIYIVLEIRQKNVMWVVGILTSLASIFMFSSKGLYASSALNLYYLVISFVGLWQWRKDAGKLDEIQSVDHAGKKEDRIHLNKMSGKVFLWSAAAAAAGMAALVWLLRLTGDPMSLLDAAVAVMSAVATYWLSRSYISQWYVWIFANVLTFALCLSQGLYLMSVLYIGYAVSAVYGYLYWRRHGEYVS